MCVRKKFVGSNMLFSVMVVISGSIERVILVHVSICMSYLNYLSVRLSICSSVHLPVCHSNYISVCQSSCLFLFNLRQYMSFSFFLSFIYSYLFIYLFICYLTVCLSVCLCVSVFLSYTYTLYMSIYFFHSLYMFSFSFLLCTLYVFFFLLSFLHVFRLFIYLFICIDGTWHVPLNNIWVTT